MKNYVYANEIYFVFLLSSSCHGTIKSFVFFFSFFLFPFFLFLCWFDRRCCVVVSLEVGVFPFKFVLSFLCRQVKTAKIHHQFIFNKPYSYFYLIISPITIGMETCASWTMWSNARCCWRRVTRSRLNICRRKLPEPKPGRHRKPMGVWPSKKT